MNRKEALNHRWQYEGRREICGLSGIVTPPLATPGDQFPAILYNAPLAAAVASISTTTLITAPSTGTYRVGISGETTVLGAGATSSLGYHTVVVGFTPAAAAGQSIVSTSTTAVTWVSGTLFNVGWTGTVTINGVAYTISTVNSTTSITLTATAGTQTAVPLSWSATAVTEAMGVLTLGTGSNYNGVLGICPLTTAPGRYQFRALAGTAISIATTLTAAGGSPAPEPNIVITPVIELLGQ